MRSAVLWPTELKLSEHVRNTISLLYKQKTGWNSDIWNFFSEKMIFFFIFGLVFTENLFSSPAMFENVIVTSYIDRFSWFWYQWKEETLPCTMYQTIILWARQFQVHKGGGNHPLGKPCYKKRLGRTRVKAIMSFLKKYIVDWVCSRVYLKSIWWPVHFADKKEKIIIIGNKSKRKNKTKQKRGSKKRRMEKPT